MNNISTNWSTIHEMRFIDGIGTRQLPKGLPELSKSELLGMYLQTMLNRVEWGEIDSELVIEYARNRMAHEAEIESFEALKEK